MDVCSYYWSKNCSVFYRKLIRKFPRKDRKIKILLQSGIIKKDGEFIRIDFLDEQLLELNEKSEKLSAAGRRGVEERERRRHARLMAGISNKDKDKDKDKDNITPTCFSFDQFWEMYGKKVGKSKVEKKYKKIKEADREIIKERLPDYVASTPDVQYRKHPITWLNGECWNDEIILTQDQKHERKMAELRKRLGKDK